MGNWYPMEHCDPMGAGVQSFYPRSHLTNTGEAFHSFIKDFVLTYAEGYIKSFLKKVTATDEQALLTQVKKRGFIKEKLLVCCFITKRRLKQPEEKLDSKQGITFDKNNQGKVTNEEKAFLMRPEKQITPAYIKYIHKEEWYAKLKQKFPQFNRDGKINSLDLATAQMWAKVRILCQSLICQLEALYP